MRWFSKKTHSDVAVPVEELGEKELTLLYNTGQVIKMEPGERLFREGENGKTVFLILKGSFKLLRENVGQPLEADIFKEGSWIGELLFADNFQKLSPIVAMEPSSVLGINESAFKALDSFLLSYIYRKLNAHSMVRIQKLSKAGTDAQLKSEYLAMLLRKQVWQRDQSYHNSEIITNLFKNLPSLPIHTTNMVQLLSDGNASARDITQLAKQDPSLVSEILKTVNSVYYSLHRPISDIQYAITYLGFNQVYQIVISNGLRKAMPNTKEFKALHEHSVIIADLVFELCRLYDRKVASTKSTIGLLHDIGKSIVLLLKMQNPRLVLFIDMLNPSKFGSILLKGWNIPRKVYETIEYQDYPSFLSPSELPTDEKESVAMLYVAHAVYDYILENSDGILQSPFLGEYMQVLNFSGLSVAELVDKYIMTDLKLKADTLPKHVRTFIMAKGPASKANSDKPILTSLSSKGYNEDTMMDDLEW